MKIYKKKTGAGGEVYSNPIADQLSSQYGLDVTKEIEDLLVQELSASINKQILNNLLNPQNVRKAKIGIIKDKIRSSE